MTKADRERREKRLAERAEAERLREGGWITTATGAKFYPFDPRREDFRVDDVAHALSHVCRFAGMTRIFYSVAEHSVRVSRLIKSLGMGRAEQFDGLMHDVAEAYLGDVPRPLKVLPEFAAYRDAEARVEALAAEAFGFTWPFGPHVKLADDTLLGTEARDLMGGAADEWRHKYPSVRERITPWSPDEARGAFLALYRELKPSATWKTTVAASGAVKTFNAGATR